MHRLLLAVAAVASATFIAMPPVQAYPFKMDVNSIAYWLNSLRFSKDPTFRKRIHSLYDCRHGSSSWWPQYIGYLSCQGYIDIVDGTYPNGTTCEMDVKMYYDSQTAIRDKVEIYFKNEYCYKNTGMRWH